MRPWVWIALLAACTVRASASGHSSYADANWQQECTSAKAAPLQPPAIEASGTLAACDESELYYGISGKTDYAGALQCGWYERAHPKATEANMFYGPGVLTMLYANGEGAPRNYDLAIRMACEQTWASDAEMALRVGHLEAMREGKEEPGHFDLCDDITSGLSMGACTAIRTRRADARREEEIAGIAARLPAGAKDAFERLRTAERAFEEARSSNEVDLSGTARGMFTLQEQNKLRDQFLQTLQRFGKGDLPGASAAQLATVERALQTAYDGIEHAPNSVWQYGTVKPEGIRETEQKWQALADAWVEFAAQAYPSIDTNAVRAQITRVRLQQLRSLMPPAY